MHDGSCGEVASCKYLFFLCPLYAAPCAACLSELRKLTLPLSLAYSVTHPTPRLSSDCLLGLFSSI